MYGREAAGTSWIAVIHATESTTHAAHAITTCATLRRHGTPPPARYAITSAGRNSHDCSIFAWNPTAIQAADTTSQRSRRVRRERCSAAKATTWHIVTMPSSIGRPNIAASIGVTASSPAMPRPYDAPRHRRPTT